MLLMHRLHLEEYQEMWPGGREGRDRKLLLTMLMSSSQRNTSTHLWLNKCGFTDSQQGGKIYTMTELGCLSKV